MVVSGGWTTAGSSTASVAPGGVVKIVVGLQPSSTRDALVDLEVYNSGGRVAQMYWDNQHFAAGTARTFNLNWSVPTGQPAGAYVVKLGVFGGGWSGLQHWNDDATEFQVSGAAPPTTLPAPTTTRPATTTTTRPASTTTTTRPASTTTTTRPATTTTLPATTTTAPSTQHFATLPVGATLPSDATCAAAVRPAAEIRPANATYNQTRGSTTQTGYYARVTGNFSGTTDEIIQWAACKWGIDEDIVRAQIAKESWWFQRTGGDYDTTGCVPGAPYVNGQCPQSVGLMQVRYPYWTAGFPSATTSSAYNLDEALAARRSCFEGRETWLGGSYTSGDIWGCVGLWFSGQWHDAGAETYIGIVKDYLAQRIWTTSDFIHAT